MGAVADSLAYVESSGEMAASAPLSIRLPDPDNEIAMDGSYGYLYMHGPDADLLAAAILPTLEAAPWMKGASLTKRYGPAEDGVREVELAVGG